MTIVSRTMNDIPGKGCRGIKESFREHRIMALLSGFPKWKQHASASLIPDTRLCAFVPPKRREFFRPESLQLASCKSFVDRAHTKRVPIIRRVRAQTVEGICSRVSRLRNDVSSFGNYSWDWRARNRDISLSVNFKSWSLVSVKKVEHTKRDRGRISPRLFKLFL